MHDMRQAAVLACAAAALTSVCSGATGKPSEGPGPSHGLGRGGLGGPCDPASGSRLLPGRHEFTITSGGMDRSFAVFVPFQATSHSPWKTYAPVNTTPLVLNWHGCNAHFPLVEYHDFISRMDYAVSERGWFAIHPVGTMSPYPSPTQGSNSWGWTSACIHARAVTPSASRAPLRLRRAAKA